MERSEPSLVPQWLKHTGTQNSGGSVLHSDDHTALKIARNKSFVDSKSNDFKRSLSFDKTTSSYFHRSSSSNGSGHLRSHSSFGRNRHDRDWERGTYDSHNKDKSLLGDQDRRYQDLSDSLGNTLLSTFERDGLRHSQSMVSGKCRDTSCNKVVTDSSTSGNNTNGLLSKGSPVKGISKVTFERDFPLLGLEEKVATSEVGRVPSLGMSSAIQSLPIGSLANINGEKWTSALAEVPILVGRNGTGMLAVQHDATSSLGTSSSLKMAEAVAQGPNCSQATPQLSVGTQRLEELAIKQSRQLIPVTPSSPKTLVLNSLDKQKTRAGQQQQTNKRGGPVKGDASRATNVGKLQVLKPVREKNIGSPAVTKDDLSQASGGKLVNSPYVSGSTATKDLVTNPSQERKPMSEKRSTSQAQSRIDFFNSVRKKSVADSSVSDLSKGSVPSDTGTILFPSTSNPKTVNHLSEMNADTNCNNYSACVKNSSNQNKHPSSDPVFPEEEEAAFLRSLGWEENDDEGGLTDEEINAFFRDVTKYISSKPSLKLLQGVQPKFRSHVFGSIAGLSSAEAKLESS